MLQIVDASNSFPASATAARMVMESSPKDWSYSAALYLVDAQHLQDNKPDIPHAAGDYVAFTHGGLDERIADYLQNQGVYAGPGPVVVIRCSALKAEQAKLDDRGKFLAGLGLLIHELSHVIDQKAYAESHSYSSTDKSHMTHLQYTGHGPRFTRAALHLLHRVNERHAASGMRVPIEALRIAGGDYLMSDARLYDIALQGEQSRRFNEPIRDVISTTFPRVFEGLWTEDFTRSAGRSGTHISTFTA